MNGRMLHQITIDCSVDDLFHALTETGGVQGWWTDDCSLDARTGAILQFRFGNGAFTLKMRNEMLIRNQKVVWQCLDASQDEWKGTLITWNLSTTDDGLALLKFIHEGWRSLDGMYASCNTTWGQLMGSLKTYLETGQKNPLFIRPR